MKVADSTPLDPDSFLTIREPWRTEWEFGVQVGGWVEFGVWVEFGGWVGGVWWVDDRNTV